jgi:prevent-host-death family protein
MKSIDETEAQARRDEILDEAQRQSIVIRRQGREIAVVLSIADYERLRSDTVVAFLQVRNDVAREANEAGLTEEGLAELLREE